MYVTMAVSYVMYPTDTLTIAVGWHKAIRRMFNLPYRTHSCLLQLILIDLPVDGQMLMYH